MSGSTFGTLFKITTWGESHGTGIGVVIDGCPAGLPLTEEKIQAYLNRRKPGQTRYSTPRKEDDLVTIQSGVFDGRTTGCPISLAVMNTSQRSKDYSAISQYYRPGHADYTFTEKYGFRDYRGGGRSSGRETIGRVAGGAVAAEFLKELGITIRAYTKSIGPISIDYAACNTANIEKSPLYMPDLAASEKAEAYLLETMQKGDSAGGMIECIVTGLPAGIGEPVFDKLDACLAKAIMSIGAVKGFEIGSGFSCATMTGSVHNDSFISNHGKITKATNHAGGILGGISDGSEVIFRAAIKPTPSISTVQQTVDADGTPLTVNITGRHDPVIVPRAVVVVESMAAITIADLLLSHMTSQLSHIKRFFGADGNTSL
ncbi:MAG: chorismate synthase [Lachnospiraceae bacterium]|nr:chorismate synthase [Lachnospiraceae bacterium]